MRNLSDVLKKKIMKVVTVVVILLAASVTTYTFFLLVIGQPWIVAFEENAVQQVTFVRNYSAIIPFLVAITIILGVVTRKQIILWIGNLILFVFSILFLFGIGGTILPIASILLFATIILTFGKPK